MRSARVAELALVASELEQSAILCGASSGLFAEIGVEMLGEERAAYERVVADLRERLGDDQVEDLLRRGRALSLAEAVAEGVA